MPTWKQQQARWAISAKVALKTQPGYQRKPRDLSELDLIGICMPQVCGMRYKPKTTKLFTLRHPVCAPQASRPMFPGRIKIYRQYAACAVPVCCHSWHYYPLLPPRAKVSPLPPLGMVCSISVSHDCHSHNWTAVCCIVAHLGT